MPVKKANLKDDTASAMVSQQRFAIYDDAAWEGPSAARGSDMIESDPQRMFQEPLPVLSNTLIVAAMNNNLIRVSDFQPNRLAVSAYQICPFKVRLRNDDEDGLGPEDRVFFLSERVKKIQPGEYAIVSPKENIDLNEGFIVDFYPSSWCIDKRLVLTAGRLDSHYKGDLVFGIFNGGRVDVEISPSTQIARASFGWLGQNNIPRYSGSVPGAYNKKYQDLREHEIKLEEALNSLERQRQEIEKIRVELDEQRGH